MLGTSGLLSKGNTKKSGTTSTSRPTDDESDHSQDEDAASEDTIITLRITSPDRSRDIEAEAGIGTSNGQHGINLETSYSKRSDAMEVPDEPARPEATLARANWQHGRFWDRDWSETEYGNTVTIASNNGKLHPLYRS
jgi:hypothetical protein